MKFFKRKDKRKDGASPFGMPALGAGFGSGSGSRTDGPGGFADNSRPGGYRPFGSPHSVNGPTQSGLLGRFQPMATPRSARLLETLPPTVLHRIFAFVCPHSQDESYETCEESSIEDACMLCDMRDLAHCVAVCKHWRKEALRLL